MVDITVTLIWHESFVVPLDVIFKNWALLKESLPTVTVYMSKRVKYTLCL